LRPSPSPTDGFLRPRYSGVMETGARSLPFPRVGSAGYPTARHGWSAPARTRLDRSDPTRSTCVQADPLGLRTQANQAGTVSSTHRYRSAEDGSQIYRQHIVTDPRREMVQSWERSVTDDGYTYRRQQVWTNPDGTPLRSHQWTTAGTDPNNYERSRTMVLRDGRTLSRTETRTWDGTKGTRERTMIDPNGQTRTFQRAWAPDGQAADGPSIEGQTPGGPPSVPSTAPLQRLISSSIER